MLTCPYVADSSIGRPGIKGSGSLVSGQMMQDLMHNLTVESGDNLAYTFDNVTDVQGLIAAVSTAENVSGRIVYS